jgi:hypothetical protein
MKLAEYIPPGRAIRLTPVPRFGDHFQIVGAISASTRVRHYVVYLMFFGIVALASTFKFGDRLSAISARDVTGVSWSKFVAKNQRSDDRDHYGLVRIGELAGDTEGDRSESEEGQSVAQAHRDDLPTCGERGENDQAEQYQQPDSKVRIHSAAELYSLVGEVSTA